ncbi:MAG: hypothetical protein QOJ07_1732 [Thermoleophilaceae bacterium]|jgi:hypothetical protein|nr:hypothetical protein [Thermoleophilaceae bacterium]
MRRLALLLTTFIALLALAAPAGAEVRELGVAADTPLPDPSCPTDCQAIGRVSGYPVQMGSLKNPFLVNEPGKVVALTLKLGTPSAEQITYFTGLFGGQASVRLTVLKPARLKHRHRLLDQSDVINVQTYFGSSPTFALSKPLIVPKRSVIALTVPTWVPAFATSQPSTTAWRFSRQNCDDPQEPAAQQTLKSLRTYACFKRTARPVYSVSFIPDPKPTTTPAKKK